MTMCLQSFYRLVKSPKHLSIKPLSWSSRTSLFQPPCVCDQVDVLRPRVQSYHNFVTTHKGVLGFQSHLEQHKVITFHSRTSGKYVFKVSSCYANPWIVSSRYVSQGKHPTPKIPSSKIMRHYDIHGSISNDDSAKQFIYALSSHERKLLLTELDRYRDVEERRGDATKPSSQQLKQVFLLQALPFIGFGFLDNLLMIVFGEYIDTYLGASLGISTMAAAALGNLISDVGGIGSASSVESFVGRLGVRAPHLSPEQVEMSSTKWSSNMGKVVGVTIGCLLGMFPLFFFKKEKDEKEHCEDLS